MKGETMGWSATFEAGVICVVDDCQGKSVTNDAENIIRALIEDGFDLTKHRLIYRDSMGIWDGIRVRNGQFAGFVPLQRDDKSEAIRVARAALRHRWYHD
jgi:hypothetical protein